VYRAAAGATTLCIAAPIYALESIRPAAALAMGFVLCLPRAGNGGSKRRRR